MPSERSRSTNLTAWQTLRRGEIPLDPQCYLALYSPEILADERFRIGTPAATSSSAKNLEARRSAHKRLQRHRGQRAR
jgi:hypothetical protein